MVSISISSGSDAVNQINNFFDKRCFDREGIW